MNTGLNNIVLLIIAEAIINFFCIYMPFIHFGRKKDDDIDNQTIKGCFKIIFFYSN